MVFTVASAGLLGVGTNAIYFTSNEGVTMKMGIGSLNTGKYKINYKWEYEKVLLSEYNDMVKLCREIYKNIKNLNTQKLTK